MALQDILISLGIDVDDSGLKKADDSVSGLVNQVRGFASAAAAAFAVNRVYEFANATAAAADAVNDTAERIGISAQALQELGFAAQMSGSSTESLNASLQILGRNVGNALGGGSAARNFQSLGIALRDSAGNARPLGDVFQDIAQKASEARSPQERMAIATRLLGRNASSLAPLLASGAEGIEELRDVFNANGGGFTGEALDAAKQYNDQMDIINAQMNRLRGNILVALMPVIQNLISIWNRVRDALIEVDRRSNILRAALVVIGSIAAAAAVKTLIAWAPVLLQFAALALGVAAFTLVMEDLWGFLNGQDSLIGSFIDRIYGIGTAANFAQDAASGFEDGIQFIKDLIPDLTGDFRVFWEQINDVGSAFDFVKTIAVDALTVIIDKMNEFTSGGFGAILERVAGVANMVLPSLASAGAPAGEAAVPMQRTRASGGATSIGGSNTTVNVTGVSSPQETARAVASATERSNSRNLLRMQQELTSRGAG